MPASLKCFLSVERPGTLIRVTGIYTNLLPENDALRIKHGLVVNSPRELDLLLEDLGE